MLSILDQINLPIIIWREDVTPGSTEVNYLCDYINSKVIDIKRGDDIGDHHQSAIKQIKSVTNYSYEKENQVICFSKMPNKSYLEIRYPYVNNFYLLSAISKKLREPLTDIIGILSLFDQLESDETSKYYIPIIQQSSYNFICLANDLVDLIEIDNGDIKLNPESFVLAEAIEQSVEPFKKECLEKNIALSTRIDKNVPTKVTLDRSRFQQIIVILLKNAIYNTQEGSVQISVSVKHHVLVLKIKDTGIGLTHDKKRIVNYILNFCNCSCNLQHEGFGLYIAKQLCKLMSATITYKSEPEIGSAFYFNAPF